MHPRIEKKTIHSILDIACQTFGRFKREFLLEIYTKIDNHLKDTAFTSQEGTAVRSATDGQRGEVLMLGNNLPGGLISRNKSSKADDVSIEL